MNIRHGVSHSKTYTGPELRPSGNSAQTIGDVLGHLRSGTTTAEGTVSEISDSLFQPSSVAKYQYIDELVLCCAQAIEDLADLPCNSRTRADVMGRAMGLLREKHGIDAPRGWYLVMKQLRAMNEVNVDTDQAYEREGVGAQQEFRQAHCNDAPRHKKCGREGEEWDAVPPESVLSSDRSVLEFVDGGHELLSLANGNPDIEAEFVALARERGVPRIYKQGLEFLNTLLLRFETAPDAVLKVRDELQRRVEKMENHQTIPSA